MSEDPREEITRALRFLTRTVIGVYVVILLLLLAGWIVATHQRDDIRDLAETTNAALCTLRADLETRVETSRLFLKDNPGGIPGFPQDAIRQSISNQEQTIEALGILDCTP